ncbi:MAG: hypothetical protein IJD70_05205 [Clostridia bacterium]|nr:hypothetical protein [Clostridia bacterium]
MKIQVISYEKKIQYGTEHNYTYSSLSEPRAFDEFELNIICLQTKELWYSKDSSKDSINAIKDFDSLKVLIDSARKSKVVICFPQNYTYHYCYSGGKYMQSEQLKDMIYSLKGHLNHLLANRCRYDFVYENSTTLCGKSEMNAAFYFHHLSLTGTPITLSNGGEHTTTVLVDSHLLLTSLDLSSKNTPINDFLVAIGMINDNSSIPEWISDYKFNDDEIQNERIVNAKLEIENQSNIIKEANEKLLNNMFYKRILYENGDPLVESVFDILDKIIGCNLTEFVDEKKEDFKIILPEITFIGEIKGITSNVKNENVSQLEVHCQTYQDYLETEGKKEIIKGILIVNPLRNKPLEERDDVHERQIDLAHRYGSLIITTDVLLLLFEAYLSGKVLRDRIIELFISKTGLLTVSDFI